MTARQQAQQVAKLVTLLGIWDAYHDNPTEQARLLSHAKVLAATIRQSMGNALLLRLAKGQ